MIDKNSRLGQTYEKKKDDNPFYKHATFHSPEEITGLLKIAGFGEFEYWQTLITASETKAEEPRQGYGEGGFVVINPNFSPRNFFGGKADLKRCSELYSYTLIKPFQLQRSTR